MQLSSKTVSKLIYTAIWMAGVSSFFWCLALVAADPVVDRAEAQKRSASNANRSTNLRLPRFVSLRADPINMRAGPGVRYPGEWVYMRRGLPVEVVAEFDTWRRINDSSGSDGWIHTSMLSARRTAIVIGGLRPIRRINEDGGEILARLEPGVVVSIQRCPAGSFCQVEAAGILGWALRDHLWGIHQGAVIE